MKWLLPWLLVFTIEPFFSSLLHARPREAHYLSFSVRNRHRVYLRDLKADEVSLFLNGKPVRLRFFGYRNVETALVFLIENSPRTARYAVSMPQFGRVNTVDRVRYHLLDSLSAVARAGPVLLAEFYKTLKVLQDFTTDEDRLMNALNQLKPNVAFLDKENIPVGRMLGRGIDLIRERAEKRKVVVLFTTTVDRESLKHLDEYRQMFRLSDVDLYVVSFAPRSVSGAGVSQAERSNRFYFRKLVGETSGRLYLSGEYVFPQEFIDDLMSRLSNSYTIGFYVKPNPEPLQYRVEIKVNRPKCDVTHRNLLVF
ncbi:MAG: hypothetical protein ACE5JX_10630 [Acidobacteriota bacterium]